MHACAHTPVCMYSKPVGHELNNLDVTCTLRQFVLIQCGPENPKGLTPLEF